MALTAGVGYALWAARRARADRRPEGEPDRQTVTDVADDLMRRSGRIPTLPQ
jgi:hypothetical protein